MATMPKLHVMRQRTVARGPTVPEVGAAEGQSEWEWERQPVVGGSNGGGKTKTEPAPVPRPASTRRRVVKPTRNVPGPSVGRRREGRTAAPEKPDPGLEQSIYELTTKSKSAARSATELDALHAQHAEELVQLEETIEATHRRQEEQIGEVAQRHEHRLRVEEARHRSKLEALKRERAMFDMEARAARALASPANPAKTKRAATKPFKGSTPAGGPSPPHQSGWTGHGAGGSSTASSTGTGAFPYNP